MKHKTLFIIFFILLFMVCVYEGIIFMEKGAEKSNEDISKNTEIISKNTEIEQSAEYIETFVENPPKPLTIFNVPVPSKYEYNFKNDPNRVLTVLIEPERINKYDCYKITYNETSKIENNTYFEGYLHNIYIIYINKENGSVTIGKSINKWTGEVVIYNNSLAQQMNDELCAVGMCFYDQWMLGIVEGSKWKTNAKTSDKEIKIKYVVADNDVTCSNRKCFKIDIFATVDTKDKVNSFIQVQKSHSILFVDKNKRILVRSETYFDNYKVYEIELSSLL